jgi:hypothetical protein
MKPNARTAAMTQRNNNRYGYGINGFRLTLFLARVISSTLKMEDTRSSETSVYNKHTRRHIPKDDILHIHIMVRHLRRQNLVIEYPKTYFLQGWPRMETQFHKPRSLQFHSPNSRAHTNMSTQRRYFMDCNYSYRWVLD